MQRVKRSGDFNQISPTLGISLSAGLPPQLKYLPLFRPRSQPPPHPRHKSQTGLWTRRLRKQRLFKLFSKLFWDHSETILGPMGDHLGPSWGLWRCWGIVPLMENKKVWLGKQVFVTKRVGNRLASSRPVEMDWLGRNLNPGWFLVKNPCREGGGGISIFYDGPKELPTQRITSTTPAQPC